MAPLGNTVGFIDDEQRHEAFPDKTQKPLVLNPLRRYIEEFETLEMKPLDDFVSLLLSQTGVKSRSGYLALSQALNLILHQGNERGHHEGQPGQERRRELIAERFSLAGRHDHQRITASLHGPNDFKLAWPKIRKTKLFLELLSEIIHGKR
jgi:hypothetical protein